MVYILDKEGVLPIRREPINESQLYWFLPWRGHAYRATCEEYDQISSIAPLYDLPRFFDPKWTSEHHRVYPPRWHYGWIIDDDSLARFARNNQLAVEYNGTPEPCSDVSDEEEKESLELTSPLDMGDTILAVFEQLGAAAGVDLRSQKPDVLQGAGIRGSIASIFSFYDNYHLPDSNNHRQDTVSAIVRFLSSEEGEEYRKLFYIPKDHVQPLWYPSMNLFRWFRSPPKW